MKLGWYFRAACLLMLILMAGCEVDTGSKKENMPGSIGVDSRGCPVSVDKSDVMDAGEGRKKAWVMTAFIAGCQRPEGVPKEAGKLMALAEFSCAEKTVAMTKYMTFGGNGEPLRQGDLAYEIKKIENGTNAARAFQLACGD